MYTFESRVRYSEVDKDGYLSIEKMIDYLQDCSTFQSEDAGVGVSFLFPKGLMWVLNTWQVEIYKYPKLCDRITIGTMPYDFKTFIGYRNFFMKDDKGEYILKANTLWTHLDVNSGKPVRPLEEQMKAYPKEERLDMEYLPRKIALPEKLEAAEQIVIRNHHLDTNLHVNNGQYIKIAKDAIGITEHIKRLRVEYKKQVFLDEIVTPYIGKTGENATVVILRNEQSEDCCIVEFV